MTTAKTCCAGLAAGAALLAAATPSPAAKPAAATGAAKIVMAAKGKDTFFKGSKTVEQGAKLTIVNESDVQAVGPHTFSLVDPALIPRKPKAQRECGEKLAAICGTIAGAHKFDFDTMKVNKPVVDAGGKGWNAAFGKKGDSWYSETKGESASRTVTAKAGTTLTYFCAVHPFMKGKLKVVK